MAYGKSGGRAMVAGLTAASLFAVATPIYAQDGEEAVELENVVTLGTRFSGRDALETMAPVDIIDEATLRRTGHTELGRALQTLAPSFNFSNTFISDGTDIIRPATLRALGPDQVLVLVNGKRRHQQALVNVQQTIGRGSAGTDINAIPVSSVHRVEVLRDGAAAQYGSDAISGVINIVLKSQVDAIETTFEYGKTSEGDGKVKFAAANGGFEFGDGGYFNATLEYRDRGETNRAGPDSLRVNPPEVTQRIGDADSENKYLWFNMAVPAGDAVEFYAFGGWSERDGDSAGFFRSAGDGRTVPDLYPEGFLPNILTNAEDRSIAAGARGVWRSGWDWDFSIAHGNNKFGFFERNSVNVSYWYEPNSAGGIFGASPTSADTGTLHFEQTTWNFDIAKGLEWAGKNPLYTALGVEYRKDGYQIEAGDPVSYQYGRTNDRTIPIFDQTGGIAAPGIQGFPGFTPETEVDDDRRSYALYGDFETDLTDNLTVGVAARYEDYTDFGDTVTGKLSARYDFTPGFSMRGTASTGFRAPGVQQAFYSQVSTNLNSAGVLTDTLTARQNGPVTQAFGIQPLQEETSTNLSLGFVARPTNNLTLTLDLYSIDIDDRIIFSSNISPEDPATCVNPGDCPISDILAPFGVGQVLFFTNAIDTETVGADFVALWNVDLANSALDLEALLHYNDTEVKNRKSNSPILTPQQLFDDAQVTLVEQGQPGERATFSATWYKSAWTVNGRANYYGSVAGQGFTPGFTQEWGSKWLFDASVGYAFTDTVSLTIGGNNIFDTYPDRWDPVNAFPFPQLGFEYCWETCPFGINGAYYYGKLNIDF